MDGAAFCWYKYTVLEQVHFAVQESHTRLIYPFSFQRRQTEMIVERLLRREFMGRPIWEVLDAPTLLSAEHAKGENKPKGDYYRTETHEAALNNIFGRGNVDGRGWSDRRYLRMQAPVANSMFPRHTSMWEKGSDCYFPFQFAQPFPVELFLSPFGVGALTFTLELDCRPLFDTASAMTFFKAEQYVVAFNYRLSQLREWAVPSIRIAHPADDPEKFQNIPENQRAKIPRPPTEFAPLVERMGSPGGRYQLPELIEFLLHPMLEDSQIKTKGAPAFVAEHNPLSVYSVVRFGPEVDFTNDNSGALGRMLSALAQIEEPNHAGSVPGRVPIPNELLNRNHWAAVSALGAAHLLSDQSNDVPFNVERARRVRDRYFLAYIAAFLQKLTIRTAGDNVGRTMAVLAARPADADQNNRFKACAPEFNLVAADMIEFNAVAYLPEISNREAINRYYRLAQDGMQLSQAWLRTNESIATLDRVCRSANEAMLLEQQTEDIGESKKLQAKVEWVEVLIIGLYIAELIHALGEDFEFEQKYRGVLALTLSVVAMFVTFRVLRPETHVKLPRLRLALLIAASGLAAYLILGWNFFSEGHHVDWTSKPILITAAFIALFIGTVLALFPRSKKHSEHKSH